MARLANAALTDHAGPSEFVTGQIVSIDLATGVGHIVNAGHPPPFRLRDGVVEEVRLRADPPFGVLRAVPYAVQPLPLRPGDRLLFLTDGVLEREAAAGNVGAVLGASGADHARQAVQHLIQAAVDASGGHLKDDATALCLDWHGGPARSRLAVAGAEPVG
jgi:serine phosphatase RsbU (regulator of sigma subunit)